MLSATNFRAAILSSGVVRVVVVRGGMPSSGLEFWGGGGEEESRDVIVAREEGRSGGRVCEEDASRRGVLVVEL